MCPCWPSHPGQLDLTVGFPRKLVWDIFLFQCCSSGFCDSASSWSSSHFSVSPYLLLLSLPLFVLLFLNRSFSACFQGEFSFSVFRFHLYVYDPPIYESSPASSKSLVSEVQPPSFLFKWLLLEYSFFTVSFLPYSKVNQSYIFMCPLLFAFPSHEVIRQQ